MFHTCPRCKLKVLDLMDCAESSIYQSRHLICLSCMDSEDAEIEAQGTNDLPKTLIAYGKPNENYLATYEGLGE